MAPGMVTLIVDEATQTPRNPPRCVEGRAARVVPTGSQKGIGSHLPTAGSGSLRPTTQVFDSPFAVSRLGCCSAHWLYPFLGFGIGDCVVTYGHCVPVVRLRALVQVLDVSTSRAFQTAAPFSWSSAVVVGVRRTCRVPSGSNSVQALVWFSGCQ